MFKLAFCCFLGVYLLRMTLFWAILMISVICHKLWMILTILFCDLLWRIKINVPGLNFRPPHWILPFISLFLLLRVIVRPSDAL